MKTFPLVMGGLALWSGAAFAAPFETCPSKAFLFQGRPVSIYGINLVTGSSELLADDTGTNGNINGVGFNFTDRYIYGFDTTNFQVVRVGGDYQREVLNVSGLPSGKTIFVGDVYNHHYYLYRKGSGFYKIDLSPLDSDPNAALVAERITSTTQVSLTDFAVNPVDGKMYGVDNSSGKLYQFDLDNGTTTEIGFTGETGTFGAGYFDVNGYYYVARNQDGQIYRIDLGNADNILLGLVTAEKFADGPYSNQNDGARCANAPVIDEDSNIDFGDAPDSYKTTLASNGPRHELDGMTWLGNIEPDGEADAAQSPNDDGSLGIDDEDGVGFVTSFETGLDSVININASTSGYLSAWIDWNRDGDFDDVDEQVIADDSMSAGNNTVVLTVPLDAQEGETWSRFRFSQQTGLGYSGGSTSGEVEDHTLNVAVSDVIYRHFPSENGYVTLAYEDRWPQSGDYDMNDVVVQYRITETIVAPDIVKTVISGRLMAVGASYHSGFAVHLPGIDATNVDTSRTSLRINGVLQESSGLELGMTNASFMLIDDVIEAAASQCDYYRTDAECREDVTTEFELSVTFNTPVYVRDMPSMPYDPFVTATPGYYHGPLFNGQPGRGLEIHLPDMAPTSKFDTSFYNLAGDDDSNPSEGKYFKTENNLPFALLIYSEWEWPREAVDLLEAYPLFEGYTESGGDDYNDWYKADNGVIQKLYR
uniref:LruC domain-containing protein n=1 Tax=Thaumasiovibrio occultus TaxID=1891184 RepID=UPI000B359D30|nr:LruC domain-containing protein [Thaumasiovibrio occultus]